ncbi:MAG: LamG domain-containing protein, partial [Planctomycetota bacterium]
MRHIAALALLALASTQAFAQHTLVARYRLDELSGTALIDESPNALSGTYLGGFTLGTGGASPTTGTSVAFSEPGVGHADIANTPLIGAMTSNVSYSAWFFTSSVQGYRRVFASQDSGIGVGLFYSNLLFTTRGVQDYVQAANVQVNTWYHATWVFDASFLCTFYLNGAPIGSVQGNGPALAATNVFHVASRSANTELWNGAIDDIQIYQGTLSASEVALLYQYPGLAFDSTWVSYCTAKTNSLGCTPWIEASGAHNANVPGGFVIRGNNVRNNKAGLLIYSFAGRNSAPFQGGILCVTSPIRRSPGLTSGGSPLPANDCSGVYSIDVAAFAHGLLGGSPAAGLRVAGQVVDAQYWGRDPGL